MACFEQIGGATPDPGRAPFQSAGQAHRGARGSPKRGEPKDLYAEFDADETIQAISKALESAGHKVILIEADENAYSKLKRLKNK